MIAGFEGFRSRISAITEAIGEPSLQPAVAARAIELLMDEVRSARGMSSWTRGMDWGTWWTTVTPGEFDMGTERVDAGMSLPRSSLSRTVNAEAEANWRCTTMRLRGRNVQVEGGGYFLVAVSCNESGYRFDRATGLDVRAWTAKVSDDFLRAARGGYSFEESRKKTQAQTEAAAKKAMRRMVLDFFGVGLANL